MEIELLKDLIVEVEFEYSRGRESNDWYEPDEDSEFYITRVDIVKGTIAELMYSYTMKELEDIVLNQIEEDYQESFLP